MRKNWKIVCAGDSITDCGCVKPPLLKPTTMLHDLGYGYVSFLFAKMNLLYPESHIQVLNHGVSGDRTIQLFDRFDVVISEETDVLSIMIGVNDVWVEFSMPDRKEVHINPNQYENLIRAMVEKALVKGKQIVILSPFHLQPATHPFRIELKKRQDVLQKITAEYGLRYVDVQSAFDRLIERTGMLFLSHDAIHVNSIGQMMIAEELLKGLCDLDTKE